MSYRDVYEKWLSSSALSEAEKEELRSISGDEKEIESQIGRASCRERVSSPV